MLRGCSDKTNFWLFSIFRFCNYTRAQQNQPKIHQFSIDCSAWTLKNRYGGVCNRATAVSVVFFFSRKNVQNYTLVKPRLTNLNVYFEGQNQQKNNLRIELIAFIAVSVLVFYEHFKTISR